MNVLTETRCHWLNIRASLTILTKKRQGRANLQAVQVTNHLIEAAARQFGLAWLGFCNSGCGSANAKTLSEANDVMNTPTNPKLTRWNYGFFFLLLSRAIVTRFLRLDSARPHHSKEPSDEELTPLLPLDNHSHAKSRAVSFWGCITIAAMYLVTSLIG